MIAPAESATFLPQLRCWVCDGSRLSRFHQSRFDFDEYRRQVTPLELSNLLPVL